MLNFTAPSDSEVHLYKNNHTPVTNDGLSNFTESSATNYSAFRLFGSQWTVSSGATVGATAAYATLNFNFSTADTIYGYYVTNPAKAVLEWAELFTGGPFSLPSTGGTIALSPVISLT